MICCDKCEDKRIATRRIGWSGPDLGMLSLADSTVLCDKCYEEFMVSFGNFKKDK